MKAKDEAYALAIWDTQTTHQSRRNLLALAKNSARMTKRRKELLDYVIDKTKTLADRRNELIHAEYVVHGRTDQLHAKVKSPRSTKAAKHQKVSQIDLEKIVKDLEQLYAVTDKLYADCISRKVKSISKSIEKRSKGA